MKKSNAILALVMAVIMLLSAAACGTGNSWGSKLDKLCDENKDISYYRYGAADLKEYDVEDEIEELIDERLDGKVTKFYYVDVDGDMCIIMEFEEVADAKEVTEYIEDEEEFFYTFYYGAVQEVDRVERDGKTVIYGDKKAVKAITE